jgi:hypothetical protein
MGMKYLNQKRFPPIAAATLLFVIVALNSPPTTPSIPEDRPEPPSEEELAVLDDLAEWVLGRENSPTAIHSNSQSFELFRRYSKETTRRDIVQTLPFGDLIDKAADRYSLDSLLLAAIVEAESSFNPQAESPQGALGLMQLMPSTGDLFRVTDLLDPKVNVDTGARYLSTLLRQFDGDVTLALAGYNAGPGNVTRYGGLPPFRETRTYVDRVLSKYVGHHQRAWDESGAKTLLF